MRKEGSERMEKKIKKCRDCESGAVREMQWGIVHVAGGGEEARGGERVSPRRRRRGRKGGGTRRSRRGSLHAHAHTRAHHSTRRRRGAKKKCFKRAEGRDALAKGHFAGAGSLSLCRAHLALSRTLEPRAVYRQAGAAKDVPLGRVQPCNLWVGEHGGIQKERKRERERERERREGSS